MCLVGVGTFFGVLTLKFQKLALSAVTILSVVSYWLDVSLYSQPLFQEAATAEIASWTYFVFFLVVEPSLVRDSMDLQISSWALLLVLLGLFAIGSLVQFTVTGKVTPADNAKSVSIITRQMTKHSHEWRATTTWSRGLFKSCSQFKSS